MRTAKSKVGLFTQEITLGLSDESFLVEKVEIPPIVRDRVDLTVLPGTVALINDYTDPCLSGVHKLIRSFFGSKSASTVVTLYPDKFIDNITITFFGGQHVLSISSLPMAKAKFAIVGTATAEVDDFKSLAKYFPSSMTKDDLMKEIKEKWCAHLNDEAMRAASKYITPETNEITLRAALDEIAKEIVAGGKMKNVLQNFGLRLSAKGITMHVNSLEDSEDKMRIINDALTGKALASLANDLITPASSSAATDRNANMQFCIYCGARIASKDARFCASCGKQIKKDDLTL